MVVVVKRASWVVVAFAAGCGRLDFAPTTSSGDAGAPTARSQLVLSHDPGELLADFPLLVVLDDTRAARDLMLPDASDLRFYDAGGNVLAHEIEQLGAPGAAPMIVWVRVPQIAGASTTLAIDYGRAEPPDATGSVWSEAYRAVWHLVDLTDATPNHHDGAWLGGPMTSAAGIAGPTLAFMIDDAIAIPDAADLAFTTALTVSGWIAPVALDATSGYTCIVARQNGSSVDDDFWLGADNPTAFADSVVSVPSGTQIGTAGHAIPTGTWTHLAMTYDGATERLYVDGAQVTTTTTSGALRDGGHPILIGADHNSNSALPDADFVDGRVDEVRLEAIVRSAGWLAYDDLSVRDELIAYGPVAR